MNLDPLICYQDELNKIFRARRKNTVQKTISKLDLTSYENEGWEIFRENKSSYRIQKTKPHYELFEDRLWCLFYSMKFNRMSGHNFSIHFKHSSNSKDKKQVDIFACDNEVALVVAGLVQVLLRVDLKHIITHLESDWLDLRSDVFATIFHMAERLI